MGNWLRRNAALILLSAALPAVLLLAGRGLMNRVSREGAEAARRGLCRAALECYALEGFYPTAPDYLYRRYGVRIDQSRYVVHYRYAAENLMPDIAVFETGEARP